METRRSSLMFLVAVVAACLLQISSAQTTHVVGDSLGWRIPPAGASAYSTWAASKTFTVNDVLVFNFTTGTHDVAQVTKADYDSCSTSSPLLLVNPGPARITLNSTGEHYYICNFTGHCGLGQKLAINVSAASTSPSPSPTPSSPSPSPSPVSAPAPTPQSISPAPVPSPTSPVPVPSPSSVPESSPSPAPSRSPVVYTVGDSLNWTVPSNGAVAYQNWAADKTFNVGDILAFNYREGAHDVAEVTRANYDSCNTSNPISLNSTAPTIITLTTTGSHYYICAIPTHCSLGQKLAINVTGSSTATPPSSSATPPSSGTTPSSPNPTSSTPDNAATSLTVAGLSATFLAVFVGLLF